MSAQGSDAHNFESEYRCLNCNETVTLQTDHEDSLITISECPHCNTVETPLKQLSQTQTSPVNMDTVDEDRRDECLTHVGETLIWDGRGQFTVTGAEKVETTMEGTDVVFTRVTIEWEADASGSLSIDDFSTHLKVGNISTP
jgi:DNA-directed RNA polymerase subunit RPC12/RpoP